MNPKLRFAFDKHAAATLDKQLRLVEIVGEDHEWNFDVDRGVLSFGGSHEWMVQVLGTQSDTSNTWLWAWGNEASGVSDDLLKAARSLKKLGADNGITELSKAELPAGEFDGHFWASLATGLCKADAYYRGSYEGGAVFLLIKDKRFPSWSGNPLLRLASVFPQAIANHEIYNHKLALVGHAELLGLAVQRHADSLIVGADTSNPLIAQFDGQNRLVGLTGKIATTSALPEGGKERTAVTSSSIPPRGSREFRSVSFARRVSRYRKLWMHHCKLNLIQATVTWGVIAVVIGLITWAFTSIATASMIASLVFALLWVIGFHPSDLGTDVRHLLQPGRVTIWLSSLEAGKNLSDYLAQHPNGFRDDVGFGPIDQEAIETGPLTPNVEQAVISSLPSALDRDQVNAAITKASPDLWTAYVIYHDLDYDRLIVPEDVNTDAPLTLVGTFDCSPSP